MTNATLIGSNKVSEAEVFQVQDVPYTRTFRPVHHKEVIGAIRTGIGALGLEVVKSEYVLAGNGMKMFGVWDLSTGNDELCWSIGIRNSMDKSMALGITAGTRVFVCENLAFDGEFVELRRHTKGLTADELEFMAYRAIRSIVGRLTAFQAWHEGLKMHDLSEDDAKIMLVDIVSQSVFPASKFTIFHDLYFGGAYGQTLWGFHEAATDVLREANLLSLPKKNRVLNRILKRHIESFDSMPSTDSTASTLGDFYERRARLSQ